jgi:hypothetical protein
MVGILQSVALFTLIAFLILVDVVILASIYAVIAIVIREFID